MEHDNGTSVSCDGFPPLCANYPWLVTQCFEDDGTGCQIFYPMHGPHLHYRCRIPELLGKRIRGFFFGWVILSSNLVWSLWNPSTSKVIRLPPSNIFLNDSDDIISQCCLSSPPDDPTSVLLLTRTKKPTFVFCRLADLKRKKLRWTEMSYAWQLKKISIDGGLVHSLTCCNGKVYALSTDGSFGSFVINIDITVKDKEVMIKLLLFGSRPFPSHDYCFEGSFWSHFLKGSATELFYIIVGSKEKTRETIKGAALFKLDTTSINWEELECLKKWDMTNMRPEKLKGGDLADLEITDKMWEELLDLKDATFLLDLGRGSSIFYSPAIASGLGGYVHIRSEMGNLVHSYHLKDKTITLSCTPSQVLPTSHVSLWECKYPSLSDGLPPLCANYPWLVSQFVEDDGTGGQIFYAMHEPQFHYRCQIPQLLGKRIRGFFHGWVILSNNLMWSLWNPSTSKVIRLPPLNILKDEDSHDIISQCCLSSPPDDPTSVLLLTRTKKPTFVFCWIADLKKKKLRWIEMSYARQLKKISIDGGLVHGLTCCNGRVYALSTDGSFGSFVIDIDITVMDKEVMIKLLLFGSCPSFFEGSYWSHFLKGYGTELFCIILGFKEETRTTIDAVSLFKLDLTNMWLEDLQEEDLVDLKITRMWEKMLDLKNAIFCVDLGRDCSILYNPAIASKLGGYIHIRGETGEIIHSYHLKDKTISPSSIPSSLVLPTSQVSWWECRLEGDHNADYKQEDQKDDKIMIRSFMDNEVRVSESVMPDIPFDVVEIIMKFCVGVEYMNFRATCKRLRYHIAASLMSWRDKKELMRLQNYSLISPWLMVVDKKLGNITFTDPLSGEKYYMKKNLQIRRIHRICCSGFGWLLFYTAYYKLVLYNPFTSDIRKLPEIQYSDESSFCFSAPPTSPRGRVFRLTRHDCSVHIVGEPSWLIYELPNGHSFPNALDFPTSYGEDLYALSRNRELLHVIENMHNEYKSVYCWTKDVPKAPTSRCKKSKALYNNFLTKWDQGVLLVMLSDDQSIEVFKLDDNTKEWRKIDGLGRHMIYITCLCIEAKIPEMENKIYLPQLHSENGRIVLYSLETGSYNTFFNARYNIVKETFCRIRKLDYPHTWIEPSWS